MGREDFSLPRIYGLFAGFVKSLDFTRRSSRFAMISEWLTKSMLLRLQTKVCYLGVSFVQSLTRILDELPNIYLVTSSVRPCLPSVMVNTVPVL
jgi:hypothetical protein